MEMAAPGSAILPQASGVERSILFCARQGTPEDSVLFVPGIGGLPSEVLPLAARIGGAGALLIADLNVIVDQAPGREATVEYLADRILSELHAAGARPALVGYSFGGLVTVEVARGLLNSGEPPPRLILIDAAPEQSRWPRRVWLASLWARFVSHATNLLTLSPGRAVREAARRGLGLVRRLNLRRAAARIDGQQGAAALREAGAAAGNQTHPLVAAFCAYAPRPYNATLTVLELSTPAYGLAVSSIWRPLVADLVVLHYEGSHLDAVRSAASMEPLAANLNTYLGLTPHLS